jgi:hypothetical protein
MTDEEVEVIVLKVLQIVPYLSDQDISAYMNVARKLIKEMDDA